VAVGGGGAVDPGVASGIGLVKAIGVGEGVAGICCPDVWRKRFCCGPGVELPTAVKASFAASSARPSVRSVVIISRSSRSLIAVLTVSDAAD
jgi:hypothetical protein